MDQFHEIVRMVDAAPTDVQVRVLGYLRERFPIHQLEAQWRVPAEVILEAIARSPDLSQRGVRGLIAEAYFETHVLPSLQEWRNDPLTGNNPFDFRVRSGLHTARIQVKSQRRKDGRPMTAQEAYRRFSKDLLVVETQKTRGGTDSGGAETRPYRFDEFDVLAVNMEPSTGDWTEFRYTLARWLLPRMMTPP